MKDKLVTISILLNIIFALIVRYENKLYNDEYRRAEYCSKNSSEYLDKYIKLRREMDQANL